MTCKGSCYEEEEGKKILDVRVSRRRFPIGGSK
jgi:hypothetical protein